jgi:hypothetical protein
MMPQLGDGNKENCALQSFKNKNRQEIFEIRCGWVRVIFGTD